MEVETTKNLQSPEDQPSFVEELDDQDLDGVAGGDNGNCPCTINDGCNGGGSQQT